MTGKYCPLSSKKKHMFFSEAVILKYTGYQHLQISTTSQEI
jgi:hypothetical protein